MDGTIVVDLETLGKWDSSIILTLGACFVSDDDLNKPIDSIEAEYSKMMKTTCHFKFSVAEQKQLGRTFDQSVLDWWKTQGPEARAVIAPSTEDQSITRLFDLMGDWLGKQGTSWKKVRLFDRQKFDLFKLQHLWEVTMNKGNWVPWNYLEAWDIASALKFTTGDRYGDVNPKTFTHPEFIYHNAASDAALDMLRFKLMVVNS